jgi:hypothetical protein
MKGIKSGIFLFFLLAAGIVHPDLIRADDVKWTTASVSLPPSRTIRKPGAWIKKPIRFK